MQKGQVSRSARWNGGFEVLRTEVSTDVYNGHLDSANATNLGTCRDRTRALREIIVVTALATIITLLLNVCRLDVGL